MDAKRRPSWKQRLDNGKVGESMIANLLKSRGRAVLPVYEKEIQEGKPPAFFTPHSAHAAPDLLLFPELEWIEAKHKSHWSWHRITGRWVTGIDLNHYEGYQAVQRDSGRTVWLFFLHRDAEPDRRDLAAGCPPECPVGLFAHSLDHLRANENHRSSNWGKHGMVYWSQETLNLIATIEEVERANDV